MEPTDDTGSGLPEGRFEGPAEFAAAVRRAFESAATRQWTEVILSDQNFEDWPLGERAVVQSLDQWCRTGRRFTVLAKSYDEIVRRHARFVTWRRTWSHLVDCRTNAALMASEWPSAIWSPTWVLHRTDPARSTGFTSSEPGKRVALRERLDECLRRSSATFASTVLGI